MRTCIKLLFVTIFLLSASLKSFGQEYFLLANTTFAQRLDSITDVYIDSKDSTAPEQIISDDYQQKFQKVNGNLTFGYLKNPIWLRLNLKTSSPAKEWYLEIPAPFLEYVDFYLWNGRSFEHSQSGYYRRHSQRQVSHTGHVLPLQFDSDSLATVYIKISGASPKTFPLFAMQKEDFLKNVRMEDFGYGIFFGILMVMFFFNLVVYLVLRQVSYLLYIITIIGTFLIFSSATGYAGMYLWPEHPLLNFYAGRMSLPLQGIAVALFTISFLELKKYSITMYYLVLSLIPLSILAAILILTGMLPSAGNHLITIGTILYMTAGVVCRLKGNITANYFIAAWAVYLIGGLFLTLRNSGIFPYNFATTHFVEIGAGLETVIIAFALAARYRRLRIEKEEAQQLALKLQQETTEKLEVKVKHRTEQLSSANDNLRHTLETNKIQTQIIEDKNAELDAFFYRISHDLKGPISSLRGLSLLARLDVQDSTARDYIEKQFQQVERLDLIVSGLINLTRLNQTGFEKKLIDFHKLTDECIHSFQTHPKFRVIRFKNTIEDGLGFYSEWTLLNAVVQNLLENAIKYSTDDNPFVHTRVYKQDEFVILEVEDNGQGIPLEHQPRIFEMFYRATDNATGTGLGLYILKRSLDRLKGTIDIQSVENAGSTFTVKLPY
jgi:signal transduction histidine kinase